MRHRAIWQRRSAKAHDKCAWMQRGDTFHDLTEDALNGAAYRRITKPADGGDPNSAAAGDC